MEFVQKADVKVIGKAIIDDAGKCIVTVSAAYPYSDRVCVVTEDIPADQAEPVIMALKAVTAAAAESVAAKAAVKAMESHNVAMTKGEL